MRKKNPVATAPGADCIGRSPQAQDNKYDEQN